MHYVLVWWYKEIIVPKLKGYSGLVVYADDFVVCFQYKEDAVMFYELLKRRMRHFGLSLQEDKSRLIQFGRFAKENCERNGHKPAGQFGRQALAARHFECVLNATVLVIRMGNSE